MHRSNPNPGLETSQLPSLCRRRCSQRDCSRCTFTHLPIRSMLEARGWLRRSKLCGKHLHTPYTSQGCCNIKPQCNQNQSSLLNCCTYHRVPEGRRQRQSSQPQLYNASAQRHLFFRYIKFYLTPSFSTTRITTNTFLHSSSTSLSPRECC